MQFFFIRHAQSDNNLLWLRTGSSDGRNCDPELTPTGVKQAQHLAAFLKQSGSEPVSNNAADFRPVQLTHLYSSLMIRALETGAAISKTIGLPLVGWRDLHETGGIYLKDAETEVRHGLPGNTRAELLQRFAGLELAQGEYETGWWNRPYEEAHEQPQRARRVLARLYELHSGSHDRVGVVSHVGFYNLLMMGLGQIPEEARMIFALNNAAITRIDFNEDHCSVVYMNRQEFLPPDLIT